MTDKQMVSISLEYGIDISRVRGVVDNANRILEVSKNQASEKAPFYSLFANWSLFFTHIMALQDH